MILRETKLNANTSPTMAKTKYFDKKTTTAIWICTTEILVYNTKNAWILSNMTSNYNSLNYLQDYICISPHITLDTRK